MKLFNNKELERLNEIIREQSHELGTLTGQVTQLREQLNQLKSDATPTPKNVWNVRTHDGARHTFEADDFEIIPGTNSAHFYNTSTNLHPHFGALLATPHKDYVAYVSNVEHIIREEFDK